MDISYTFDNGYCLKGPCPAGFYLEGSQCEKCTDYCNECQNLFTCDTCADGFEIEEQFLGTQRVSFCAEICGDGRKFEDECDDENTDSGDGCSDQCEVEHDWTCFGGSTAVPSSCL